MIGRVILPGTDLSVSRLSYGTASLHHLGTSRARQRLLQRALDIGITHFDSSPYYGFGLAEEELGALKRSGIGLMTVATKVGLYPPGARLQGIVGIWARKLTGKVFPMASRAVVDWSISTAAASLERSLKRLRTDCVDILFLHEPDPSVLESDELLSWIARQRQDGKIRHWGLAGNVGLMRSWLARRDSTGCILQVKDSLEAHEADLILANQRILQITYGYFHSTSGATGTAATEEVLAGALKRNQTGSVLFSTRRLKRLALIGEAAIDHR